jgi:tetratricopeptide (TPR) repeat protein
VALCRELAAQRPDAFRPDLAQSLINLANRLGALGRYEPALAAAEEAATLYREPAAQWLDPFQPHLAVSLAVQANCLDALNRTTEALTANIEAITALSEVFIEQPAAFGHWMVPMVKQYRERCERLGRSPDMALLGPVIAILQGQHAQTGEKQ